MRQSSAEIARLARTVVVDESGAPRLVFRGEHGGDGEPSSVLQTRRPSLSFGSLKAANTYALDPNDHRDRPSASRVIPAYLRIEKPFLDDPDDPFVDLARVAGALGETHARRLADKLQEQITGTGRWLEDINDYYGSGGMRYATPGAFMDAHPDRWDELYFDAFRLLDDAEEVALLRAAGFDGAIHAGNGETAMEAEYRVFDASQVVFALSPSVAPAVDMREPNSKRFWRLNTLAAYREERRGWGERAADPEEHEERSAFRAEAGALRAHEDAVLARYERMRAQRATETEMARKDKKTADALFTAQRQQMVAEFTQAARDLGVLPERAERAGQAIFQSFVVTSKRISAESDKVMRMLGEKVERKDPERRAVEWLLERAPETRRITIVNNTRPYVALHMTDEQLGLAPSEPVKPESSRAVQERVAAWVDTALRRCAEGDMDEAEGAAYEAGRYGAVVVPEPITALEGLKKAFERGAADAAEDFANLAKADAIADGGFDPFIASESRPPDAAQARKPATPFTVTLGHVPNPDLPGGYWGHPVDSAGPHSVSVATLREASAACRAFIDRNGLGGGNWAGGDVFDGERRQVARISYNGRVWGLDGEELALEDETPALPMRAVWVVESVVDRGQAADYRFAVAGTNLANPAKAERFNWSVPSLLSESYDLSAVEPYLARAVVAVDRMDTAAFADIGRSPELQAVMRQAAERAGAGIDKMAGSFDLRDTNGEVVGRISIEEGHVEKPVVPPLEGQARVVIDLGAATFHTGRSERLASVLGGVAEELGQGELDFTVRDEHGATIGVVMASPPRHERRSEASAECVM